MNKPAPLIWNERLMTGVAEIDEQHRILVHTLNEAAEKLSHHVSLDVLETITQDLLSYALYHFETEEMLMHDYGYTEDKAATERHLDQHHYFSSRVMEVRKDLKAGILISGEDLIQFLNDWLVQHIMNTDRQLADFILARRKNLA